MLVSGIKLEMSFWNEWSRGHRAETAVECCDEALVPARDQRTSSTDQVDSRQFLTWEDLVGQR
ncbi:hypothetical protein SynMEDNS5_01678 [Synechococcus sp. MEDNS5]|nr:hypothetical protein SynMEDNS5_01678 [Synechococcus sp. MEDNS5]